tara:strand:+ start:666 stop:869 length:204 start_codon:yes stop_codon:yes gene_type:complete
MASIRVQADPVQITGTLDMRKHQVVGLETDLTLYPLNLDQGASKKYVDAQRDAVQAALEANIDNGSF